MNSQLFFFLNFLAGLAFLAWFLTSRKDGERRPTKLKMKEESAPSRPDVPLAKSFGEGKRRPEPAPFDRAARGEKSLNVLFIYNGHDWDAYQVLGLPAGASLPMVTQRYQELVRTADRGQLEFYEAAHQAILRKS